MVLTRSQATKADQRELESMEYPSDNESECSAPEVLSRDQIDELDGGNLIRTDYNLEQRSIDQRFSDMNKQISDLTGLVLALTEKLSSNVGEGNNQSTASDKTCARSDMVTGVSPTNYLMNPHTTHQSTSRYPQPPAHQFNDIVTEIHHLRDTMTDTVQHPKILQTQVPLFRGNREKYNEFEHLLLNHLRPHQHKLSEEQKLTYFQSLLRDDAIEFWQSLKMTNQTTLAQVLRYFKKEYAKEDLKEVAKYKCDQMRYDLSAETFNDFLNKFKKVAKQAFGDKSSDITNISVRQTPRPNAKRAGHGRQTRRIDGKDPDNCATQMSICPAHPKHNQCATIQSDKRTTAQCSHTFDINRPTSTNPRDEEKVRRAMPSLRHTRTQVGGMQKTVARRSASQNRQPKNPATKSSYPEPRQSTQVQLKTCVPNLRKGGTLCPRLLPQEHDHLSIQKCSVHQTIHRRKQTFPKGL